MNYDDYEVGLLWMLEYVVCSALVCSTSVFCTGVCL
jgi:hypothetical protein